MPRSLSLRLSLILLLTLSFALLVTTFSPNGLTARVDEKPQQQKATVKTVEQAYKNIQVLKGMPETQLLPVMNFMSTSLGVRCDYCHVNKGDVWDFVADDKEEKSTARDMVRMVQGINKTTFHDRTEVSCWSCHRGRTRVPGVPALPVPAVSERTSQPTSASQPSVPTIEQVLARQLEALGGAKAVDSLKTRVMKGTYITSSGDALPYEVYQSAPDSFHSILNTKNVGAMDRVFDGTTGWLKNNFGMREFAGVQTLDLKRFLQFFRNMKIREQFARLTVSGKETIDGKEVYAVRGSGDTYRERLFFDVQSGLLVRRITYTDTMIGIIPEQTEFSDYRDVDGVKLPFTIRISSVDQFENVTQKFIEIRVNVPVPEKMFQKP